MISIHIHKISLWKLWAPQNLQKFKFCNTTFFTLFDNNDIDKYCAVLCLMQKLIFLTFVAAAEPKRSVFGAIYKLCKTYNFLCFAEHNFNCTNFTSFSCSNCKSYKVFNFCSEQCSSKFLYRELLANKLQCVKPQNL